MTQGGNLIGAAADAEGTDSSLLYLGFKELQEAVVLQVCGGCLMEEPEVDVVRHGEL